MTIPRFRDRADAGRALGTALGTLRRCGDVLVVGLARGGIPVARQVADVLQAPLDVVIARKLGVPGIAEVALGAIAEGSRHIVLDPVQSYIGVPQRIVRRLARQEREELARRARVYREERGIRDLSRSSVVLIDDGLATGASLRAAVRALKRRRPARLIVAVPVAAARSAAEVRSEVDELIALETPETLGTVSDWYEDFSPVTDAEVLRALGRRDVPVAELPSSNADGQDEHAVVIAAEGGELIGDLGLPAPAATESEMRARRTGLGLAILAHGGGSSRNSYRNRYLAARLRLAGLATLRIDLLTAEESIADREHGEMRFDVMRIARRLVAACDWVAGQRIPDVARVVLLGASTGAAAALVAAAERPSLVSAVATRGGRVDLAGEALARVSQPVLLVVGAADTATLLWNRQAMQELPRGTRLDVIPGAGHIFDEPGALGAVGERIVHWLERLQRPRRLVALKTMGERCWRRLSAQ